MNKFIAYCGLNCEKCEARIATENNDDELREQVAKKWTEWNKVNITKDMINCEGCRIDGKKTPYCESLCEIRKCAMDKKYETCGSCSKMSTCEKVGAIINNSKEALNNLKA